MKPAGLITDGELAPQRRRFSVRVDSSALIAALLALVAVAVTGWISTRVYEGIPHIEDEQAYVWQAQVMARGQLTSASPPCPTCFLVPFVIDHAGQRFGKYPPAWPVVLSFAERLDLRAWVNPLLAGLAVWLTYRLGQRAFSRRVGLLAAMLTLTSPFFLMNSATLLSHPWALVLAAVLSLAWMDTVWPRPGIPAWLAALTAGLCLGALALTRPLTAMGVAVPFLLHGLWVLWRGPRAARLHVLASGGLALVLAGLLFVWQSALTGNPFTNPYTLWWPYDQIGFGPGIGLQPGGYSLAAGVANLRLNLAGGSVDLFGWPWLSWLFLPLGGWAARRSAPSRLVSAVLPALIAAYLFYWIGAALFGPRYYYEGLFSGTLLSAAGILWAAGIPLKENGAAPAKRPNKTGRLARLGLVLTVVGLLVGANLAYYTPARVGEMRGLYGFSWQAVAPFLRASREITTPALIIVHKQGLWEEYGRFLVLQNAYLDTPFIFAYAPDPAQLAELQAAYPERAIYHYYAQLPDQLFKEALPTVPGPG